MGKGFGYVNFTTDSSVAQALRLNGQEVCGRKIRVNKSVRKPKSAVENKAERKLKNKQNRNTDRKSFKSEADKKGQNNKRFKKKGFQGVNTSREKKNVKKPNKQDKKNKTMAKILSN